MTAEPQPLAARARVHAALGDPGRLAIVDALLLGDASPGELARVLNAPTNLIAHHVKVLRNAGLVAQARSEGDRRRTYLRIVPEAMAGLAPPTTEGVSRVVFVCTHNSARSPLAAALWARHSAVPATSAGTLPAGRVHSRAVRTARRHGLDLDHTRPRRLTETVRGDDLLISVCDNAHEQLALTGRHLHWSVPDPAPTGTDAAFESAYTDLAGRIARLAPVLAT